MISGHLRTLDGDDLAVETGEVVALIGDNGAGKSALVKVLSETESPTWGQILMKGDHPEPRDHRQRPCLADLQGWGHGSGVALEAGRRP